METTSLFPFLALRLQKIKTWSRSEGATQHIAPLKLEKQCIIRHMLSMIPSKARIKVFSGFYARSLSFFGQFLIKVFKINVDLFIFIFFTPKFVLFRGYQSTVILLALLLHHFQTTNRKSHGYGESKSRSRYRLPEDYCIIHTAHTWFHKFCQIVFQNINAHIYFNSRPKKHIYYTQEEDHLFSIIL